MAEKDKTKSGSAGRGKSAPKGGAAKSKSGSTKKAAPKKPAAKAQAAPKKKTLSNEIKGIILIATGIFQSFGTTAVTRWAAVLSAAVSAAF